MVFFTKPDQKIPQFVWKHRRPWTAKANLRKQNGAGGINLAWLHTILPWCSDDKESQWAKHAPSFLAVSQSNKLCTSKREQMTLACLRRFGAFCCPAWTLTESSSFKEKKPLRYFFFLFFPTRYRIWGDTNPIIETAHSPCGCERYCSSVPSPSFLCQSHIHTAIHTSVTSPLRL